MIYAQSFREVQFCDDTPRAKKRLVRLSASNVKYTDLKAEMAVRITTLRPLSIRHRTMAGGSGMWRLRF